MGMLGDSSAGGGGVSLANQTISNPTVTGVAVYDDGTVGTPSIRGSDADSGIYWSSSGTSTNLAANGVSKLMVSPTGVATAGVLGLAVSSASSGLAAIEGVSTNSIRFSQNGTVTTTSRTEINKVVTGIADNSATAAYTVTIPNGAHSASIRVVLKASLGAGGSIGANESTRSIEYRIDIARTAGVNAVATISAAGMNPAAAIVAGGQGLTVTGGISAISGAVGASNSFTINVTVARAGAGATNHTCFAYVELLNDNASGVTIA